jgi:hypothetical protein
MTNPFDAMKAKPHPDALGIGNPNEYYETDFRKEIQQAINKYSKESGSNTPDFILARYLTDCLEAYDRAVTARQRWYSGFKAYD